jgi:hypothetical protein
MAAGENHTEQGAPCNFNDLLCLLLLLTRRRLTVARWGFLAIYRIRGNASPVARMAVRAGTSARLDRRRQT